MVKIGFHFAPHDLRVGFFWRGSLSHLYIHIPLLAFVLRFPRRILCHTFKCDRPAVMLCVHKGTHWGENFSRDPLCSIHGKLGPCPELQGTYDEHIPIVRKYYYEEPAWQ
jgi:hypothetical protein